MATDTLIMFGDSYSDFYTDDNKRIDWNDEINCYVCWPRMIDKDYPLRNFSEKGCSPQEIVSKFQKYFEGIGPKRFRKRNDIKLLIFMPDPRRMSFSFLEGKHSTVIADFIYGGNKRKSIHRKYHDWINKWVQYYVTWNNHYHIDEVKYYTFFKAYSEFFKQTVVIPTVPLKTNLKHLNSKNFTIVDWNMDDIQTRDHKKPKEEIDYRINHLTSDNHYVMYSKVEEYIRNGTVPNQLGFYYGNYKDK